MAKFRAKINTAWYIMIKWVLSDSHFSAQVCQGLGGVTAQMATDEITTVKTWQSNQGRINGTGPDPYCIYCM